MTGTQERSGGPRGTPRLLRRLATLRTLEWANVAWLAIVLLWWLPAQQGLHIPGQTWQRSLSFLPVGVLLIVGGWYWHIKLHQLRDGRTIDGALRILDFLDRVLLWILVAYSGALVVSWTQWAGRTTDRAWATGLLVLAWAEFVNYFRVQLMHDTMSDLRRLAATRRLRRSWLASDLASWRAARTNAGSPHPQ